MNEATGESTPVSASFEVFVSVRGAALWRAAWLLTGDHQLAEDLIQAALAKSWRAWDRVGSAGFEATALGPGPLLARRSRLVQILHKSCWSA